MSYALLGLWLLVLVGTILNLLLVPRLQPRFPRRIPLVSVIIPARDEERTIGTAVRRFLEQTWPALEVIVVDDRSTDSTGSILAALAAEDGRLQVIHGEEPPSGWLGKPWALHQGSLRAEGELLLFVDADVLYEPDAVAAAVARMEESDVALLALLPHVVMKGVGEKLAMPQLAIAALGVLPLWIANRSRSPVLAIGGGTGNMVRRADYVATGGHEALRDAVIDDIGLARLMRRGGMRTEAVRAEHLVSVRMYHGLREIIEGFTKNAFALFNRSVLTASAILLVLIVGHAGPYVLALTGDRIAILTVGVIALSRLILFRALGYGTLNALFGHLPMMTIWFGIFLRSMWFTGVKRQLHWRGRRYDADATRFGAD